MFCDHTPTFQEWLGYIAINIVNHDHCLGTVSLIWCMNEWNLTLCFLKALLFSISWTVSEKNQLILLQRLYIKHHWIVGFLSYFFIFFLSFFFLLLLHLFFFCKYQPKICGMDFFLDSSLVIYSFSRTFKIIFPSETTVLNLWITIPLGQELNNPFTRVA